MTDRCPYRPAPIDGRVNAWRMFAALRGNIFDTFTAELYGTDHARHLLGPYPIRFLMTAAAIRYVFRDNAQKYPRLTAFLRMGHRVRGDGLLSSEGPSWLKQRRILGPAFGRDRLSRHHPRANATNDRLRDTVRQHIRSGHTAVDIVPLLRRWSTGQICKLVFSDDADSIFEDLVLLTRGASELLYRDTASVLGVPDAIPTPTRIKATRLRRKMEAISRKLLARRRQNSERFDDVFDHMLHTADKISQSKMSDQQLIDNIITFLFAGVDTTANSLAFSLYLLGFRQDLQEKLLDEFDRTTSDKAYLEFDDIDRMALTRAVVDEAMRYYPVTTLHVRMAAADDEAPFGSVRKGDTICVPSWVTHFRSDIWQDPEAFRPERFLDGSAAGAKQAYLPFGIGQHQCIGNVFARRMICLALATLVANFRFHVAETFRLGLKARPLLFPVDGIRLSFVER
jgi:cytochrome P450